MKILYINCVCGVGSTGRIVADLAAAAKAKGHSVRIACSTVEPIKNVPPDEVIIVGSKTDYYSHNILSRLTDHEGLFSQKHTKKLIKKIQKFNPDIVHLHNLHGHWLNYEILFAYLAKENKKVIWTLHDCWPFTGHCAYFDIFGCEQWKKHCIVCEGLRKYPMCLGAGDVYQNFERKKAAFTSIKNMIIVTPSHWLKNVVSKSFLGAYPITVIHNKIDLSVFKPTQSFFRLKRGLQNKIVILGVSNSWTKEKGLNDFIEISNRLGDKYACVLVGLQKEQIQSLPKEIIGIEKTHSKKELAEIYTSADVFLNMTYQDNYPTVNLEAISCGTPVISYKSGGSCEAFDKLSGISVEKGDIDGVIAAIPCALALSKTDVLKRADSFASYGNYDFLYSTE